MRISSGAPTCGFAEEMDSLPQMLPFPKVPILLALSPLFIFLKDKQSPLSPGVFGKLIGPTVMPVIC